MKVLDGRLSMQSLGKMIALIAAFALAPPAMPSILCIAPGSHVAIEELDADCCASFSIPVQEPGQTEDIVGAADECEGCTDYLIGSLSEGWIPESAMGAGNPIDAECNSIQPPAISISPLFIELVRANLDLSNLHHCSIPLRC